MKTKVLLNGSEKVLSLWFFVFFLFLSCVPTECLKGGQWKFPTFFISYSWIVKKQKKNIEIKKGSYKHQFQFHKKKRYIKQQKASKAWFFSFHFFCWWKQDKGQLVRQVLVKRIWKYVAGHLPEKGNKRVKISTRRAKKRKQPTAKHPASTPKGTHHEKSSQKTHYLSNQALKARLRKAPPTERKTGHNLPPFFFWSNGWRKA